MYNKRMNNIVSINIMATTVTYTKNNKYFKLNDGKRERPIFNQKGKLTQAFKKLVSNNSIKELPNNFKYVFNTKTKRFIEASSLYDKRNKTPVLKKKFKEFELSNGIVKQKKNTSMV